MKAHWLSGGRGEDKGGRRGGEGPASREGMWLRERETDTVIVLYHENVLSLHDVFKN